MNSLQYLVSAEFIRTFAWTLLHSLWQGGLIALLAAGSMMILRKHKPVIRYTTLYILMLLLPVFFVGTFLVTFNPANTSSHEVSGMSVPIWQSGNSLAGNLQTIPITRLPQAWYGYLVHLFENQAKWFVMLWFAGFLVFLLRFSGSFIYIWRLKNYQVYPVDDEWITKLGHLSEKLKMSRKIKLAESALARIPLTIGYLKPVILLPVGTLSGVPPQQIEAILLHELAHILRKDYILNILQSVIELLFFYHPVTWWLSGMIRQEREHICDDLAVAVNKDHLNYIKALTTMEELNSKSPFLASAMAGSKKKLLLRVKRLLSPVKLRNGLNKGIVAFILLAGLIFALSLNALSIIPNAYDLTGRESGEKVYSLLNTENNQIQAELTAEIGPVFPTPDASLISGTPDTIVARSKSGKVVISVYTDSTSQQQQEELNKMAESMDRQAKESDKAAKKYEIEVRKFDEDNGKAEKERRIVVIGEPDSIGKEYDSVVVIYNDDPYALHQFNYKFDLPECSDSSHSYNFDYFYSIPDLPDLENLNQQIFALRSDSLDTLIFKGPGAEWFFDNKDLGLASKEWQQQMEEMERNIEKQQRDVEKQQREIERIYHDNPGTPEPGPFYYNVPPEPPMEHNWKQENHANRMAPSEKIIRQELIDDGLASPNKKYVIDLNSKGMYINGEKQSKEIYRKYKHLVESLELSNFQNEDTYRLIF